MSYILDALRRADAERDSGGVPGLHTQQYGVLPGDDERERPLALIAVIVLLALTLAGVLAWQFLGGGRTAGAPPPTNVVVGPAGTPSPMPSPRAAVAPNVTPGAMPDRPSSMTPTAAPTAASAGLPAGDAKAARANASKTTAASGAKPAATSTTTASAKKGAEPAKPTAPARERRPTPPRTAAAKPDSAGEKPPARAATEERLYTQAELPEAIRRDLPRLTVGGASYSKDAASRMVILNGQVFHEGDKIAPGLVLQTIRLKSAVLAYKGYRYELNF